MLAHTAATIDVESSSPIMNPSYHTEWWTPRLAWPVIAAAVVRLTLLAVMLARGGNAVLFQGDTISYLEPGRNLLLHGHYFADGVPDLVRTPGYSLFLAITSLAGPSAAAVANVILSVLSVILVWKLGRAVFGDNRIALGAAWIFAFEPIAICLSVVLLAETLFLAFLLLCMERLAVFLRGRRLQVLAAAGLWLAAATFVRPVTYYLPVALAVGLFVVLVRVPGLRWKAPAVLLISVLPWLAAWQIRNWVETGYRGFSSISDVNLYFYNAAAVTASVKHRHFSDVQSELGYTGFLDHGGQSYLYQNYLIRHPEQAGWGQAQRLAFMHTEALGVIRRHYGVYLRLCRTSLLKTVVEPGTAYFDRPLLLYPEYPGHATALFVNVGLVRWGIALFKAHPWEVAEKAAFEVVLLVMYLFAARGALDDMHNACLWLLLGTSLYFLAVSAVVGGLGADARYRLPIMPFVCILAAAGVWRTKTVAE